MIIGHTLHLSESGPAVQHKNTSTPPAIVADVLFGSPRNNCAGSGICQVIGPVAYELPKESRWNCKRAVALIRIVNQRKAAFHFVKDSICSKAREACFKEQLFIVSDKAEMKLNSWSKATYWILPGVYHYKEQGHFITMIVDIAPSEKA